MLLCFSNCKQLYFIYICLFIYLPAWLQFPLPSLLPLPISPIQCSFVSVQKGQVSTGYQQSVAYQVMVRLNTSPCIQTVQGSYEKQVPKSQHQEQPLFSLLGASQIDLARKWSHTCRAARTLKLERYRVNQHAPSQFFSCSLRLYSV